MFAWRSDRVFAACLFIALSTIGLTGASNAAPLGYGTFLGTFPGNPDFPDGTNIESLLGLGNLDLAGKKEVVSTNDANTSTLADDIASGDFAFSFDAFKDDDFDEPVGGHWSYFGSSSAAGSESATIDLYLPVKYDGVFSVFYYSDVAPGDSGLFSSDAVVLETALGIATCTPAGSLPNPGGSNACIKVNKNEKSFAISNVSSFIPATNSGVEAQFSIPLPAPLMLLLSALGVLVATAGRGHAKANELR